MPWIAASLLSAFFLGFYDLSTKHAVRDNAVLPVLFFANVCSTAVWLLLLALDNSALVALPVALQVDALTGTQHLQLLLKSTIVAASWLCSYFALKSLPLSIAAPIRSTGPMWTLFGALLVLGERPNWIEMLGVGITLASFVGLSLAGAREGIHFHKNKAIAWLLAGTLLGAVSGLYDKFLMAHAGFRAGTVQCWFSIYLALIFLPLVIGWKLRWWPRNTFQWRWTILGISFALLIADFLYFDALRNPEALVSLVSSLRRGSTLVAFAGSLWLFKEANGRQKIIPVLGILTGIVLTVVG
ncbi:DMT family transporter [Rariglobus hedericola]|uniref:DMT family transporter n=1 Tax=Rariglobus hedericola TaxID=2597822 RepID=A0A556QNQ8_9BACT|nr:DMT family transporter [Rariglobus hedericola]TSJ78288.1 DMT family transporter [Rariglobus hedericola]